MNSKIVYLEKPYKLVFRKEEIKDNTIEKNKLICETLYTVISPGTETAAYVGKPPLSSRVKYPRLLGYCNISRVIKIGNSVKNNKVGDYILTFSPHCSHFKIDQEDILCTLPKGCKKRDAVCAYIFHLGYNAVINTGICYGAPVVVIGLGAIGLATVMMANKAGARVFAISDGKYPSKIAKTLGARLVVNRKNVQKLMDILGSRLSDYVISTTSSWDDWNFGLQLAGNRSMIGVVGFPGRGHTNPSSNPLDSEFFYKKQLTIKSLGVSPEKNDNRGFLKYNEKDNLSFIVDQIKSGSINPKFLVSKILPAEDLEFAYKQIINKKQSAITYILRWKK